MDMNLQPRIFTDYLLKMCKIDVGNFTRYFTVPNDTPGHFCHYLKNTLKVIPQ